MTKALLLLLALAALAAMLRRQFGPPRTGRAKGPVIEAARKCPGCGAYVLDGAPCARPECQRG